MMKRSKKTGEHLHWCGPHWKSDVEGKNPEAYRVSKPKPKKKVVKKSASASRKIKVVKK
jgi:hypothetical protein